MSETRRNFLLKTTYVGAGLAAAGVMKPLASLGASEHISGTARPAFMAVEAALLNSAPEVFQAGAAHVVDQLRFLEAGSTRIHGFMDEKIIQQVHLRFKPEDLSIMVEMYRNRKDHFAGGNWADGEMWGKAVRAMVKAYCYRPDSELRAGLDATVSGILSTQTADGCISTYPYEKQPYSGDLWGRKYVLLGLEDYYVAVNKDPRVLEAMIQMADYTLGQVGPAPKVRIVDTGWDWNGIESSSILEPMVRLYLITGLPRYLEFARYIVEVEGGCKRENMFEAVLKKDVREIGHDSNPTQGTAKQYEMTSCFEGLVEYYRATGNQHWRDSGLRFYQSVLNTETTVVGSGGGLGTYNKGIGPNEQWNDSTRAQIHPVNIGIEACAGPRWMGFCGQMLRLTGDPEYADTMELAMENAVLGSIKPDGTRIDYHNQLNGTRNNKVGWFVRINEKNVTCCVYNVADALALVPMTEVMSSSTGPVINFYFDGEATAPLPDETKASLRIASDYPKSGKVTITVNPQAPKAFNLKLRIPGWSENTGLKVNGKAVKVTPKTYADLNRKWSPGDTIHLDLDMKCHVIHPPEGSTNPGEQYFALQRGPVVLVRDARLESNALQPVALRNKVPDTFELIAVKETVPAQMEFVVPVKNGSSFHVIDFASAGGTWDTTSEYRTWISVI
jgi:DUF1680 family protein